jgi:hypothetical protein
MNAPPIALQRHRVLGPQIAAFVRRANAIEVPPGSRVTSWYRTPEANDTAAGAEFSQHLLGLAFDVVTPKPRELVALAQRAGLVALYHNAGSGWHVHVQARPRGFVQTLIAAAPELASLVGLTPRPAPAPRAPTPATSRPLVYV